MCKVLNCIVWLLHLSICLITQVQKCVKNEGTFLNPQGLEVVTSVNCYGNTVLGRISGDQYKNAANQNYGKF